MSDLVISCLSQKGGVGKSTLARLIARTYAEAGWSVKICDFNTRQLTSVDWVALRMSAGLEPEIAASPTSSVKKFGSEPYDLLVVDGAPDSDQTSLEAARLSKVIILPTGTAADDIRPQVRFANELVAKGVSRDRMIFVLNKTSDNAAAFKEARDYLESLDFQVAETDLPHRHSYEKAMNHGYTVAETKVASLDARATALAAEIVDKMSAMQEIAA